MVGHEKISWLGAVRLRWLTTREPDRLGLYLDDGLDPLCWDLGRDP
jgi:hypothetical protein